MGTHAFQEDVKAQRLCLTSIGEARLWYQSLRHITVDWNGLQDQFRQRYSKMGNTREQLFHTWRSFCFDKSTETLDTNVTCIKQVAALLGYGKLQILEVFKNTLPKRLHWVLFPIDDLSLAVEMTKRILTREKINRQLAGQSTLTPFMNVRDGYHSKKAATFDTHDRFGNKIVKLTSMMNKLTAHGNNQNKHFKPKIYQGKKRGQTKNYYDQGNYQTRHKSNSGDRRMSFRGRTQYGQNCRGRPHYADNYRMILGE